MCFDVGSLGTRQVVGLVPGAAGDLVLVLVVVQDLDIDLEMLVSM